MKSLFLFLLLAQCLLYLLPACVGFSDAAPIEILAAGDVVPAGRMAEGGLPVRLFSRKARLRIERARLFIWNCETSGISRRSKGNVFTFHAGAALFSQLYFPNGVAVTANNHVFDGYEEGALSPRTLPAAGFMGPGVNATVTSAAQVLEAADDAPCVLEGHLVERIPQRKDRYLFEDESGRVVVKIKRKTFGPLTVTPHDRLRLMGEVEWSGKRPNEVDVEGLALLP